MSGVKPVPTFLLLEDGSKAKTEDDTSPSFLLLEDAVVSELTDLGTIPYPINVILADLEETEEIGVR